LSGINTFLSFGYSSARRTSKKVRSWKFDIKGMNQAAISDAVLFQFSDFDLRKIQRQILTEGNGKSQGEGLQS
jgi:hypothetical protein